MQPTLDLSEDIVARVAAVPGAVLSASLYAVAPQARMPAAGRVGRGGHWLHADLLGDGLAPTGVGLDLIGDLRIAGLGPIDVHLMTTSTRAAIDAVLEVGVQRITWQFEAGLDVAETAEAIRAKDVSPWLAVAPTTSLALLAPVLGAVDGILVMLIEPGTQQAADLTRLDDVTALSAELPVGVDGGLDDVGLGRALDAGARYCVVGRALFAASGLASDTGRATVAPTAARTAQPTVSDALPACFSRTR